MLFFAIGKKGDTIEIQFDERGAEELMDVISGLSENDHEHLTGKAVGGDDLDDPDLDDGWILAPSVTIRRY